MTEKNDHSSKAICPFPLSLWVALTVKSFVIFLIILFSNIGLGPDEAQYWTWSRELAWGYYSKPPGIAWEIWLGTQLFGNTELGVRFLPLVLGFLLPLGIYLLARHCSLSTRGAFWSAIIFAFSPIGFLASFLAITDTGMIIFWTLACAITVQGYLKGHIEYVKLGLLIACGALFKWPIYLFWLNILAFYPFSTPFRNSKLLLGVLVSLLGLLPSVIWNYSHQWPTFQHVFATVINRQEQAITTGIFNGNFGEFLGSQALLFFPLSFLLLLFAMGYSLKNYKKLPFPLLFCFFTCTSFLSVFLIVSIFKKMQGNWVIFVYPTASVLLGWYVVEVRPQLLKWLKISIISSILLFFGTVSIPWIQSHSIVSSIPIPYKINPFRHNLGWDKLGAILSESGYDPSKDFLFGDKYQTSSVLSFYGPGQKRAYFFNLHGIRKNQFSFWPEMKQEQLGKTGYFVVTENAPHLQRNLPNLIAFYEEILPTYFDKVEYIGLKPLFESYGNLSKAALIFKCIDYNGLEPPETNKY